MVILNENLFEEKKHLLCFYNKKLKGQQPIFKIILCLVNNLTIHSICHLANIHRQTRTVARTTKNPYFIDEQLMVFV